MTGLNGPAPTSSGPSAGGAGLLAVSADARRAALVSRSVVRLAVVVVEVQAARRLTASKEAASLIIILLGLRETVGRVSPDGLYNYYILLPFGKKDFSHARLIFAKARFS
jgi:hypothetical protein